MMTFLANFLIAGPIIINDPCLNALAFRAGLFTDLILYIALFIGASFAAFAATVYLCIINIDSITVSLLAIKSKWSLLKTSRD